MAVNSIIVKNYPWGDHRRFYSYSNYFKKLYGERVQKVSIDAGFTCPNRDGTKGTDGCTYCKNDAFNPSYCDPLKSISQQLDEGISFLRWRYKEPSSFLAYFQAFSATYAPLEQLMLLYNEALSFPGVIGLVIGTRPDCIDEEKLDYFKELSEQYYITIEYGVESCYDKTLNRINRGHSFKMAEEIIKKTASKGISTGAHFIFGLPGETREEMMNEADIISALPISTVKFHQLQIIKGTMMEKEFREKPDQFRLFSFQEYIDFFISFLERLNPHIVVERFTGEAPPVHLAITPWGNIRTDQMLALIEKRMEELDTWQGRLYICNTLL